MIHPEKRMWVGMYASAKNANSNLFKINECNANVLSFKLYIRLSQFWNTFKGDFIDCKLLRGKFLFRKWYAKEFLAEKLFILIKVPFGNFFFTRTIWNQMNFSMQLFNQNRPTLLNSMFDIFQNRFHLCRQLIYMIAKRSTYPFRRSNIAWTVNVNAIQLSTATSATMWALILNL